MEQQIIDSISTSSIIQQSSRDRKLPLSRMLSVLILLLSSSLLCSCASTSHKHAKEFATSLLQEPTPPIGSTSTHRIDMSESGFYTLSKEAKGLRNAYCAAVKINHHVLYCPLLTELIVYLHHKKTCSFSRIWEPGSVMRERLISKYGPQPELFDPERHLVYYWYLGATKTQSLILIGPEPFGKADAEQVTRAELKRLLDRIKEMEIFDANLRYLGTASSPRPPYWGEIHYFDLLNLKRHVPVDSGH